MTRWTAEAVQAAAADWTWVPPDATQLRTDEYQLVAYPEHYFTHPVCVLWSRSERPVGELISEVAGHARVWGHTELYWDVSAVTRPTGTEAELLRRGATLAETEQVLGYDMTAGLPELGEQPGVRAEVIRDEASVRAGLLVNREVWGGGVSRPRPTSSANWPTPAAIWRTGRGSVSSRSSTASPRRSAAARWPVGWPGCGARAPGPRSAGGARTRRCWATGWRWPGNTARRWPW